MALNCNKEIPGVTDYEGTVGVPAGQCYHCHTGRCPVGITTQDPELRKRLYVEDAAERVYNFLHTLTLEVQMLARACGKTSVHSLEPEDLAALTLEASAMAKVPLAGTDYIPGVTEERALGEIQDLLDQYLENPVDYLPTPAATAGGFSDAERSEASRAASADDTPSRRRSSRSTPSTCPASASPIRRTSRWSRTSTSRRHPGRRPELARGRRAAHRGGHAGRLRPLLELVPADLLPDPRGARERDRPQGADRPPAAGNSYGTRLKREHAKFAQPELGPWVEGSTTVGGDWKPSVLEGWEPPQH